MFTSPVIAMLGGTAVLVAKDNSAVTIVIPAEGPSLGVAPSGTWRCISARLKNVFFGSISTRNVLANVWAI